MRQHCDHWQETWPAQTQQLLFCCILTIDILIDRHSLTLPHLHYQQQSRQKIWPLSLAPTEHVPKKGYASSTSGQSKPGLILDMVCTDCWPLFCQRKEETAFLHRHVISLATLAYLCSLSFSCFCPLGFGFALGGRSPQRVVKVGQWYDVEGQTWEIKTWILWRHV